MNMGDRCRHTFRQQRGRQLINQSGGGVEHCCSPPTHCRMRGEGIAFSRRRPPETRVLVSASLHQYNKLAASSPREGNHRSSPRPRFRPTFPFIVSPMSITPSCKIQRTNHCENKQISFYRFHSMEQSMERIFHRTSRNWWGKQEVKQVVTGEEEEEEEEALVGKVNGERSKWPE